MNLVKPDGKRLAEREGIHALQDLMLGLPDEEQFDVESLTSAGTEPLKAVYISTLSLVSL